MEKIESAFRERARALSPSRNSASTKASLNSIFRKVNDENKVHITKRQNELYNRYRKLFFLSSPSLSWQHGTRQQRWYVSGTL